MLGRGGVNEASRVTMELQLDPEVRGHVKRLTESLAEEFTGIYSHETIERYVDESLKSLSGARFKDFVPLFVHRFARERLRALAQVERKMAERIPEVLFVCVHNAGRSQMAAGLLDKLAGIRVHVRSAGSDPADRLNPNVVAAMAEVGVDLEKEFPKPLTDEVVRAADAVITMGCGDACPIYPGKRYEDWELDDPAQTDLAGVRRIRDDIAARVRRIVAGERAERGRGRGEDVVGPPRQGLSLGRRLDHLRPPVGRVRPPPRQALVLELVDQHGRVGRVDPERGGELAHRHGLMREPADGPRPAEAHPQRFGDLAPSQVVEHEIGHEHPDVSRQTFGKIAHAATSLCVRRADAVARRLVATSPSTSTTAPKAVSVHQPGWLAAARSAWPACDATIAPTTATPSVWPNCREVVAIAAATPAWARGMPDTAALVIGALTNPNPIPKIT